MPIEEWLTPAEAAQEMSKIAGYQIKPEDIRQLRRTGKLKRFRIIGERITLYSLEEIRSVKPVNKRNKVLIDTDKRPVVKPEAA